MFYATASCILFLAIILTFVMGVARVISTTVPEWSRIQMGPPNQYVGTALVGISLFAGVLLVSL